MNRRVPQKSREFLNLLRNCSLVTKDSAPRSLSIPTFALRVVQNKMKRETGGLCAQIPTLTSGVHRYAKRMVCMPAVMIQLLVAKFHAVFQEYRAPCRCYKWGGGGGTHQRSHSTQSKRYDNDVSFSHHPSHHP
jgi:hypothetical protein